MTSPEHCVLQICEDSNGFIDLSSPDYSERIQGRVIKLDSIQNLVNDLDAYKPSLIILASEWIKEDVLIKKLSKSPLYVSIPLLILYTEEKSPPPQCPPDYQGWVEYLMCPVPAECLIAKVNKYLQLFCNRSSQGRDDDRYSQLEAEKETLEEKLDQSQNLIMLGKLASGVAHDFNNVLGGILGYAEMAKFRFAKSDSALEKYMDSIIAFSKRAGDLTKEILAFARGSKDKQENINLHRLLLEVQDLLSHSIPKKYQIKRELQAESAVMIGDQGLVQNAVINIVLNARDAMPQGGEIFMQTQNCTLDNASIKRIKQNISPGEYILLSITDNGTGMDEEILSKVFQPFYTTKEKGKGTGLGLSSVLSTVVKHKGAVTVKSKMGEGTTFDIYFPLSQPDEAKDRDSSETKFLRGIGHLLIVDDEKALRDVIGGLLTDYGYTVSSAADGVEAIEFYREHAANVDLVIIDMNLPRCSGRECYLAMKEINPKVKAIISTGFNLNEEAEQVLQEGVQGFIQKPFEMRKLLKLIYEVLE